MNDDFPSGGSHRPRPSAMHISGEGPAEDADREAAALADLRSTKSLERLRDRIQKAVGEIARLRDENAALAARLSKLESGPQADEDAGLALRFDEDPELLRRKISGFIEAIDRYLEEEPT